MELRLYRLNSKLTPQNCRSRQSSSIM